MQTSAAPSKRSALPAAQSLGQFRGGRAHPGTPAHCGGRTRGKALSAAARTPRSRGPESADRRTRLRGEKAASPQPELPARLLLGPPPDFGWRRWPVFEGRIRSCWGMRREGNAPELLERPWERRKMHKPLISKIKIRSEIIIPLAFPLRLAPPPPTVHVRAGSVPESTSAKRCLLGLEKGDSPLPAPSFGYLKLKLLNNG